MNEVNNKRTLDIFNRAVRLETEKRYTEALACYKEGILLTTDIIKVGNGTLEDSLIKPLQDKLDQYQRRVDMLKEFISQHKENERYHEEFLISNNETGYSYETLFGRFLDHTVKFVIVEDPYIRSYEQFENLLRLCELLVQKCPNLTHVAVVTSQADPEETNQELWFTCLKFELIRHRVSLVVKLSNTYRDKCVSLSTGWIIILSRGIDIHKPPRDKYGLGYYDFDLRPCYRTKVDIYYTKNVRHARQLFFEDSF